MSENFTLDENRASKWNTMQYDTQMYARRNEYKIKMALNQLLKPKTPLQHVNDYIKDSFF